MRVDAKDLVLAAVSTALALVLIAGAYEAYERFQYRRWKAQFETSGDWLGGLTIASPDPVLLWEYRPNGKYTFEKSRLAYTIATNRYGFRDYDYPVRKKPQGIFRIAFIGDSITLGLKVEERDTFVRQISDEVNRERHGASLEALNFGVDGYSTVQIHQVLKTKVLAFEPDKVVYVLCLNDFDFEDASGKKLMFFHEPDSHLMLMLRHAFRRLSRTDYHEYHFGRNRHVVFEQVREMKRLLDARGIDFQVAIVPVFDGAEAGFASYRHGPMHEEIARELGAASIPVVDLLETFRKDGLSPKKYAVDTWHPNAHGHQVIARGLIQSTVPLPARKPDDPAPREVNHQ